jgi:hypothetical protein
MLFMTPEERIRELCRVIALERDPNELEALLRKLEFALAEFNLELQNRTFHFVQSATNNPAMDN